MTANVFESTGVFTSRELLVMNLRPKSVLGLGVNTHTLKQVADLEGVTPERIRQSENKAYWKMQRLIARATTRDTFQSRHVVPVGVSCDIPPWELLDLSVRTSNVLRYGSIDTLDKLLEMRASHLLKLPNCGRKSLRELEGKLADVGLRLRQS